jgi:hypothetical protein
MPITICPDALLPVMMSNKLCDSVLAGAAGVVGTCFVGGVACKKKKEVRKVLNIIFGFAVSW